MKIDILWLYVSLLNEQVCKIKVGKKYCRYHNKSNHLLKTQWKALKMMWMGQIKNMIRLCVIDLKVSPL